MFSIKGSAPGLASWMPHRRWSVVLGLQKVTPSQATEGGRSALSLPSPNGSIRTQTPWSMGHPDLSAAAAGESTCWGTAHTFVSPSIVIPLTDVCRTPAPCETALRACHWRARQTGLPWVETASKQVSRHERPVPADGALRKPCSAEEARLGATRDLAATELHVGPWQAEGWVRELAGSDQKCPPGVCSKVLCTQLHMEGETPVSRWEGEEQVNRS